ncbi:FKBP-type peptidyl-prolyl cis-trans isomerase [Kangiella sp. HZ709]|uniref:FKBP-type peptidyl-prolyl cis-trans isomerase n=1 Tax=Kangiella sp. HZ709 TaxID=2666328 RepID=UPI0012AF592C|nr:FKBP-type peptidyl-prolyl cis-trans isomerase [Kangiella sp. HZ709]MRX27102.1 FKBP-type peptidyl-prolyl cis-trans isomerase [Kangiella sp. HZ709]
MQIKTDSKALVHFNVLLKDGSAADSTRVDGKPVWFVLGDGSLTNSLELHLIGMQQGETKKFELAGSDIFGPENPDNIHFMDIDQFPADLKLEEGAIVAFEQMGGGSIPGMICGTQGHSVKVDFNHPLAGQEIILEVEILEVK